MGLEGGEAAGLTGVKRAASRDVSVTNDKCRFAPRVQVIAPNAHRSSVAVSAVNVARYVADSPL